MKEHEFYFLKRNKIFTEKKKNRYHYTVTQIFIKINILKLDKFSYKILFKYFFYKLYYAHIYLKYVEVNTTTKGEGKRKRKCNDNPLLGF